MSWYPEYKSTGDWNHNAFRLETREEAEANARDLVAVLYRNHGGLFVDEQLQCLGDLELARLALGAAQVGEHAAQLLSHVFHTRRAHDLERSARLGHNDYSPAEDDKRRELGQAMEEAEVPDPRAEARRRT